MKIAGYASETLKIILTSEEYNHLMLKASAVHAKPLFTLKIATWDTNILGHFLMWDPEHGVPAEYFQEKGVYRLQFRKITRYVFPIHECHSQMTRTDSDFPTLHFTMPTEEDAKELAIDKMERVIIKKPTQRHLRKERIGIELLREKLNEAKQVAEALGFELVYRLNLD